MLNIKYNTRFEFIPLIKLKFIFMMMIGAISRPSTALHKHSIKLIECITRINNDFSKLFVYIFYRTEQTMHGIMKTNKSMFYWILDLYVKIDVLDGMALNFSADSRMERMHGKLTVLIDILKRCK